MNQNNIDLFLQRVQQGVDILEQLRIMWNNNSTSIAQQVVNIPPNPLPIAALPGGSPARQQSGGSPARQQSGGSPARQQSGGSPARQQSGGSPARAGASFQRGSSSPTGPTTLSSALNASTSGGSTASATNMSRLDLATAELNSATLSGDTSRILAALAEYEDALQEDMLNSFGANLSPADRARKKLLMQNQAQAAYAQLVSQIQSMNHDTAMSIIRSMR